MSTTPNVLLQRHRGINVERKVFGGTVTPDPNPNLIYDVPRGGYIGRQMLTLRGSLVVSVGAASGTSLGPNPGNLLQQVIVEAVPAGQIKRLLPRSLVTSSILHFRRVIQDTALTGAAGTFTLLQPFYLHYASPNRPSPYESALQTDRFASIQVRVNGGGRSTQFSGNDRTFDWTAVTLDLSQQVEFMGGKTALVYEDDLVKSVTGANPSFTISEFPLGQRYDWISFYAETTNQQLADTIINRLTVRSGGLTFWDALGPTAESRAWSLPRISEVGTTALTGIHWAQLNPDWTLGGAVDVRFASQLIATLDVSNPGTDRIIAHSNRVLLAEDMP